MKLFKTAKPLLTWQQPPLFEVRTRDRRGWMLRGALALLRPSLGAFRVYGWTLFPERDV